VTIQTLQATCLLAGRRVSPARRRGFTIIELMIAVLIVGILVSIAFPSYQNSIRKANRRHAQAAMMELSQRESAYLMDQRSFGTMASVGYGLPAEVSKFYTFAVTTSAGPPPSFIITATPKAGTTQENDGALTLNNVGAKSPADKW
jgi:type IV pilus assembly protein PilE